MRHPFSFNPAPTPEEIDAVIRRAHHERAVAFRRILGSLFRWRKDADTEPTQGLGAAACR